MNNNKKTKAGRILGVMILLAIIGAIVSTSKKLQKSTGEFTSPKY